MRIQNVNIKDIVRLKEIIGENNYSVEFKTSLNKTQIRIFSSKDLIKYLDKKSCPNDALKLGISSNDMAILRNKEIKRILKP